MKDICKLLAVVAVWGVGVAVAGAVVIGIVKALTVVVPVVSVWIVMAVLFGTVTFGIARGSSHKL